MRVGGFAEYVCAAEEALTLKPTGIDYVQAAAIPQAAVLALQGLRDRGKLQKGQRVLINGAVAESEHMPSNMPNCLGLR